MTRPISNSGPSAFRMHTASTASVFPIYGPEDNDRLAAEPNQA